VPLGTDRPGAAYAKAAALLRFGAPRMPGQDFVTITPVLPLCEQPRRLAGPSAGGVTIGAITPVATPSSTGRGDAVSSLRGAAVDVDVGRAGRVLAALCIVGVAVTATALLYSGARKNAEIEALHQRGVLVTMTVDDCRGLLGGSGSNAAGYSCWGSFTRSGRRYTEYIPGTALHAPGSKVPVVTLLDDPAMVTTPRVLAGEQASSRVFLLPSALLAALAVALGAVAVRRRCRQPASRSLRSRLGLGGSRLGEAAGGV
jgi:hypothetical protein